MQPKHLRQHPNGAFVGDSVRRSVSGASTASHDSSVAHDSAFEVERRYAPLQPQPLSQQSHLGEVIVHGQQYGVIDHSGMDQINRYNNAQAHNYPMEAQQLHAYHGHNPFAPTVPSHNNQVMHNQGASYYSGAAAGMDGSYNGGRSLESMPPATQPGTDGEKKDKKASNTTAANEKELRELLEKNEHRSLESIARDVRNAERTQKSEKAKQLFAMRWLRQYCKQDRESVPRNRVYTHYAQRCGTDRVDILNAASFGKLVRVIFPGIQTRRLGVRGESKYHYVNLTLCEDNGTMTGPPSARDSVALEDRPGSTEVGQEFGMPLRVPADSAAFPAQEQSPERIPTGSSTSNPQSLGRLFAEPTSLGYRENGQTPQMFTQSIKFCPSDDTLLGDEPMKLPNIIPYLPPKTDTDTADALSALYRTHCTSLIDAVRYVKERQFTRLLGSFHGTMTVPVSKLFSHPNLAPWIQMCDWLMYQQIVRFVSQLALQVIPQQVFSMLGNVSDSLTQTLRKNLQNYPEHVMQAKLEPATIFASLLKRLLRVNETAHAAANLLTNDQMRNMMWQDWVRSVKPKRVVETELPECGHEEVYNVLTKEIRQLLEPLEPSDWYETGTEFQSFEFPEQTSAANTSAEGILDRWSVFLTSLPGRFPQTQTRHLLQYISTVGTASLRDITVNQAQSFGGWWITKVWVDEMMLWLAEMGGFLEVRNLPPASPTPDLEHLEGFLDSDQKRLTDGNDAHQATSIGLDFEQLPNLESAHRGQRHTTCPPMTTFKYVPTHMSKSESLGFFHDQHDDSGIGMSLLGGDELLHARLEYNEAATRALVS